MSYQIEVKLSKLTFFANFDNFCCIFGPLKIDFTVKNRFGEIEYYQVAWEISNIETEKREFMPLESLKDNYPKYLLSTESFTRNKNGIIHKNVFEWLLERR